MRKEYQEFKDSLPLHIQHARVLEYPMHWQEHLEIIFVLRGQIQIAVETGTYTLSQHDIEIINPDEVHRIFASEDNRVLLITLDNRYLTTYYKDLKNMFFYTKSKEEGPQTDEEYERLRTYLSILLYEAATRQENFDKEIARLTVDLLYFLLNNFNYLVYDNKVIKDDEHQLDRFHRIVKYIYSHYDEKISLQDLAKKEFLSSQYLSSTLKEALGYSFKDFLNLTRVEESVKLLLNTDKSLTAISEELGFSHIRYFNKHFKKHYRVSPKEYRQRYRMEPGKEDMLRDITLFPLEEAIPDVTRYLESYARFSSENRVANVEVDLMGPLHPLPPLYPEILHLGEASLLEDHFHRTLLNQVQRTLAFSHVILTDIFSEDLGIYLDKGFHPFTRLHEALSHLLEQNLRPLFLFDSTFLERDMEILEAFLESAYRRFGDYEIRKWRYALKGTSPIHERLHGLFRIYLLEDAALTLSDYAYHPVHDSAYMVPHLIHRGLHGNGSTGYVKLLDDFRLSSNLTNEVFCGDRGIFSHQGIPKPAYFAYQFLAWFGKNALSIGKGYAAAVEGDDVHLLLYNYNSDLVSEARLKEIFMKGNFNQMATTRYAVTMKNLPTDFQVFQFLMDETHGSAYNFWKSLNYPGSLRQEEKQLILDHARPFLRLSSIKKSTFHHMLQQLEGYGAAFILLKKYKNT